MIKRTLCFTTPAYLSLANGQLVVRRDDDVRTVPIEDVGVVVLEDRQVTITNAAVAALLANNCALVTCDERHMPAGLMLPLQGNTLQSERFRLQAEASLPLKKQLWQQTVQAKIHNQAAVLKKVRQTEVGNMTAWEKSVRSGDADNLEGRAAAYYWKHLFHEGFTRDPEGASPNNLLNYGYAILRAVVARALVASGLLPTFGIFHRNRYNAYCLADDIMEPYRPYVDELVTRITASGADCDTLTTDLKRQLLGIPVADVTIDGTDRPLMVAVSVTTASLYKCFAGEQRKLSYPIMPL